MKVYVYKNGLCDPANKIGTCRQFATSADVDEYIGMFVHAIKIQHINNYRIFVTNDEVDFVTVDHYVLMHESLWAGQSLNTRIKEINLIEVRRQVDEMFNKLLSVKEKRINNTQ